MIEVPQFPRETYLKHKTRGNRRRGNNVQGPFVHPTRKLIYSSVIPRRSPWSSPPFYTESVMVFCLEKDMAVQ
jgi:hypothetical protein